MQAAVPPLGYPGVTVDLGKVTAFASALGTPLKSKKFLNLARNSHCLSRLKPNSI